MPPRQRKPAAQNPLVADGKLDLPTSSPTGQSEMVHTSMLDVLRRQPVWIVLAAASGACAAINGVFAKLTTTSLTSNLSAAIATFFSLAPSNTLVDLAVRGTFFLLNIAFNAAMWALFTAALTRADSSTRASIVNVSANFFLTAVLGWIIFSEQLNGMWWGGAALLAAGNVVIGMRETAEKPSATVRLDEAAGDPEEAEGLTRDGGDVELDEGYARHRASEETGLLRRGEELDSPL